MARSSDSVRWIDNGVLGSSDQRLSPLQAQAGDGRPFVVSPAFVNAHSHLEYRSLWGRVPIGNLGAFLRGIGEIKGTQTEDEVLESCLQAATENRAAGVWWIEEHSDRIGSRQAFEESGLKGRIFQEVITLFADPDSALESADERAARQQGWANPHAVYTVHDRILDVLIGRGYSLSIHVCESEDERALFTSGTGSFADRWRELGRWMPPVGQSPIRYLADHGYLAKGNQLVHACAIDDTDIELISGTGTSVAHCPRSNTNLGSPPAPVRKMLRAGIPVGIGLDSAASGGPIDFFSEMRAALAVSRERAEPLEPEEVWRMATTGGEGEPPLLGIWGEWNDVGEIIERATPEDVFWLASE